MRDEKSRDLYILGCILDYIAQCERVIQRFPNSEALSHDQDAFMIVKGDLEAVGEGVGHLSKIAKEYLKKQGIPTEAIQGFRNYLAHGYFGLDVSFVYPTCLEDLPPLKNAILKYPPMQKEE